MLRVSSAILLGSALVIGSGVISGCTTVSNPDGQGCCTTVSCCPFEGNWAFKGNNYWMGVKKGASGACEVTILWGGGTPIVQDSVVREGDALVITSCRQEGNARAYGRPMPKLTPERKKIDHTVMRVKGDVATIEHTQTDGNGKVCGNKRTFTATRIPALPPAPKLSAIKYGQPINLLANFADWEPMGDAKKRHFGWTMKDGVLSNRIARNADGTPKRGDLNIRTKRADFEDFKISYDVRVLPNCNSGVYLRGIYELQVIDSYGKPVNSHNMAALYGRVTPSAAVEKPANEWQHVEAILCDRHLTVTLNGTKIIDNAPVEGVTGGAITSNEFIPGPLYLQGDHSDADYRNMVLTPIVK